MLKLQGNYIVYCLDQGITKKKEPNKSLEACIHELHWPTLIAKKLAILYNILHGRYDSLKAVISMPLVLKHIPCPLCLSRLLPIPTDTLFVNSFYGILYHILY